MEKIDLTKCNNLRYKAKIDGNDDYGRICVENADTGLAFLRSDREDCYVAIWNCDCPGVEGYCGRKVTDFEIVPRDPETYQDWQVGDIACEEAHRNARCEVIFRSGELVLFKDWNNCATNPFTCSEAFRKFGFRLVLTDIEKQIIEERKWEPQAGDICFAETGSRRQRFIIIYNDDTYSLANFYGSEWKLRKGVSWEYSHIRPATDDERQQLFDAMAKEGKRWNAEKKVVEDIPKPHEFKEGEPVLVKDYDDNIWKLAAFRQRSGNASYPYEVRDERGNYCCHRKCIPYNERTMHLLGTTEDYKESE